MDKSLIRIKKGDYIIDRRLIGGTVAVVDTEDVASKPTWVVENTEIDDSLMTKLIENRCVKIKRSVDYKKGRVLKYYGLDMDVLSYYEYSNLITIKGLSLLLDSLIIDGNDIYLKNNVYVRGVAIGTLLIGADVVEFITIEMIAKGEGVSLKLKQFKSNLKSCEGSFLCTDVKGTYFIDFSINLK